MGCFPPPRRPILSLLCLTGSRTHGLAWGYAEPGELAGARLIVAGLDELADALREAVVWSTTMPRDAA